MSTNKKTYKSSWDSIDQDLYKRLDKRFDQAKSYTHIRHAITDTKKRLQDHGERLFAKIKTVLIPLAILAFILPPFFPIVIIILIIVGVKLYRDQENKIAYFAFFAPINDVTDDKLNAIYTGQPTRKHQKKHEDYQLIQEGENPWIK